tara:strand:+ start:329 stop:661 length:333 start_codon:yes stop_codon:yes gene_type:complete
MNEWYAEIDVNSNIESVLYYNNGYSLEEFDFRGENTSGSVTTNVLEEVRGLSYTYFLQIYEMGQMEIGCIDITLRIYKNGKLKTTENFEFGYISPDDYCSQYGNVFVGEL